MIPGQFEYHAPATLDEALALLAEHGSDARVLAGGQSLIPLMKLRLASPAVLIDLNGVDSLSGIEEQDGQLRIGAMTRHSVLERSELIGSRYPLIADAAAVIADPLVRNRGTTGGSLAHGRPGGRPRLGHDRARRGGSRHRPRRRAHAFDRRAAARPVHDHARGGRDPHRGARAPARGAERGRLREAGAQGRRLRHGRRRRAAHARERQLRLDWHRPDCRPGRRRSGRARPRTRCAAAASTRTRCGAAAVLAAAASDPAADLRGSEEYKRDMVRVLTLRALRRAIARAGG